MDSINIIDPSYGNPTDGTGSLVSNQIKFKKESRNNIEKAARAIRFKELSRDNVAEHVEGQMNEMSNEEAVEKEIAMEDRADIVREEVVEQIAETPAEKVTDAAVSKSIKEKSDYAKRLEARVNALEAVDVDAYVNTLKPIPFSATKPLKIKPGNYSVVQKNGRMFATMVEVPETSKEEIMKNDITMDNFKPTEEVVENDANVPEVELSEEAITNPIIPDEGFNENAIVSEAPKELIAVPETKGFEPDAGEIPEVNEANMEQQAEEQSDVVEIPDSSDAPLTEDDIRDEIEKILAQEKEKTDTSIIDSVEDNSIDESIVEVEPVVENIVPETTEWVPKEEAELEQETNERDMPVVIPSREEENSVIEEKEEEDSKIDEVEEELHYDYSDVTEKDVENIDSIKMLDEMKKALAAKKQKAEAAKRDAVQAESELKLSLEEVAEMRKKAAEIEKAKKKKIDDFNKFMAAYDEEVEDANKRREKASGDNAKHKQEIEDYKATIASDEDLMKEIDSMMNEEESETKRRK